MIGFLYVNFVIRPQRHFLEPLRLLDLQRLKSHFQVIYVFHVAFGVRLLALLDGRDVVGE